MLPKCSKATASGSPFFLCKKIGPTCLCEGDQFFCSRDTLVPRHAVFLFTCFKLLLIQAFTPNFFSTL
ncbi:hypothetical protein CW304_26370 [Bacillus sp. UFRGS-B20]|nr:hypothetical protein CW304_26370 [Bacillus sp. UFRGS-B20]